jgi:hypothetical protein
MIASPVRAAAMSILLAVLPAACASSPAPSSAARHFDIVNGTHDRVQAIAVAVAESPDFDDVALAAPLGGGHQWTTVALPPGPCLRDVRVHFRDGRAWLYRGIDVCRHQRLRMTARDVPPAR